MGDTNTNLMQRVNSSSATWSSSFNPALIPSQPFTGISPSLPPSSSSRNVENLPPRKSHRRSNSDVTFQFREVADWSYLVKEEPKFASETMDDVFTAYMNLDNIDVLNYFGGEDGKKGNVNVEELEGSRGSGTKKTNGGCSSGSEGESSASGNNVKEKAVSSSGVKRSAEGDVAPTNRHQRSLSMDSCFMGKLNFGDESGNREFTAAEMKKIAADEKLAEIVMTDPKRVKRILANRVSAARSKERKTRYIAELEHKVQTLQTEATTLSAQLTHLQRDLMGLTNQNSELKFRLQAMEQQAQLRDALTEKLKEEVQRLKLVIGEIRQSKTSLNPEMFQQLSISQLQHQQHSNKHSTFKAKDLPNE